MPPAPSRVSGREHERVVLGRITGPFGVRGWVKVASYTDPPEQILGFPSWQVAMPAGDSRELRPLEGRRHGKGLVARIEGIADRDGAMALAMTLHRGVGLVASAKESRGGRRRLRTPRRT